MCLTHDGRCALRKGLTGTFCLSFVLNKSLVALSVTVYRLPGSRYSIWRRSRPHPDYCHMQALHRQLPRELARCYAPQLWRASPAGRSEWLLQRFVWVVRQERQGIGWVVTGHQSAVLICKYPELDMHIPGSIHASLVNSLWVVRQHLERDVDLSGFHLCDPTIRTNHWMHHNQCNRM